ncbi:YdiU family protein [Nocardioides sp.]|uniref:protein adenylyltransferase SelO n=1 Tax=Nocardioides sp. TaxID=35761 RepID=UPI00272482D5|nr:YdiU family protein [Nocardioides sp.]MDO9456421.1 YdiU family protein [Nocardioides sp.]
MTAETVPTSPTLPVTLSHRFADDLPELALDWQAETAPAPQLLVLNQPLAVELGLDPAWLRTDDGVRFLVGNLVPEGARPVAQAYAGHQFGGYSPRLGDGRALLLGELTTPDGTLRDLHLKGSGRTPFARGGDGLAVVGPMLREYVVSEAMHALGVPTTRALAVVATGRTVQREVPMPGAVLTRVASSHLRVGSFQYARALAGGEGDRHPDLLRRLVDHAVARHHPDAAHATDRPGGPALALFEAVVAAQADLVARWMLVGFVHGVMNTDNVTISGETIDYGPCAFLEAFDPTTTFSSIDEGGRYAYGNQPPMAEWDLARLAEALLPLFHDDEAEAITLATTALQGFRPRYSQAWDDGWRAKLGLADEAATSEAAAGVVDDFLAILQTDHPDLTSFLVHLHAGTARDHVLDVVTFDSWQQRWESLGPDRDLMERTNPVRVPRNHLVEEALTAATAGDLAPLGPLLAAIASPWGESADFQAYAGAAPDTFGQYTTYCGT